MADIRRTLVPVFSTAVAPCMHPTCTLSALFLHSSRTRSVVFVHPSLTTFGLAGQFALFEHDFRSLTGAKSQYTTRTSCEVSISICINELSDLCFLGMLRSTCRASAASRKCTRQTALFAKNSLVQPALRAFSPCFPC